MYCPKCGSALEGIDIDELDLVDRRLLSVDPLEFDVEEMAAEVMAARPDAHWSRIDLPAEEPRTAPVPDGLEVSLVAALERTGRVPLYAHQSSAIERALAGANVIQATAAGSGKSLGLLLPVLDRCLRDQRATAIVVYPLRALANDQLNALERLGGAGTARVGDSGLDLIVDEARPALRVARYDGSTLDHEKKLARLEARVLITTPDSLHASLLRMAAKTYADKSSWTRLLSGLSYVVVDEIHAYQGVFGSAVAQVLRRLRRASARHASTPQFLAASATIGNPVEVAEKLTGMSGWELVDEDGSPRRQRTVLICNPPTLAEGAKKAGREAAGGRVAPQTLAIDLVAGPCLTAEEHPPVRTICFGRSRMEVFALTKRLQGRLKDLHAQHLVPAVAPYTATLLSADRVTAEGRLRDGTTISIVSTNALELGIDIPELSVAVLCGYPGQISSFRQRAGRVGRSGAGLVVLVVGDDPLQQFIAQDESALQSLLAGRPEDVVLNPEAPEIVRRFGLAPGQEDLGGIAFEDRTWFGDAVDEWLANTTGPPDARHGGVSYWKVEWQDEPYAPLRSSSGGEPYTVVVGSERRPVGVIDAGTAPRDAFVPAIWNGPDESYRVVGLDHKMHHIICEGPVDVAHLTRGVPVDSVAVRKETLPRRNINGGYLAYGELEITRQVFSYKEVNLAGGEVTRPVEPPRWPPVEFMTEGLQLQLDRTWLTGMDWPPGEAVKGLEHVLLSLTPVVVACDPYDVDASNDGNCLYIYDAFGGGIGISRAAFDRLAEVIGYGQRLVESCACTSGCPSCVFLARRPDGNSGVSKAGAHHLLTQLANVLGGEAGVRSTSLGL